MYKCATCNSTDVEQKCWVQLNSSDVITYGDNGEVGDNWCNYCQDHVVIYWEENK